MSAKVHSLASTEVLRARYKPMRVRVLFVGEAPPAGGTFFYAGNSQVFRYVREALQAHLGNPDDFLLAFAERGYFLDDLVTEPVDQIPRRARRTIYEQCVPLLVSRILALRPEVVVSIMMGISSYVEQAIADAGTDVRFHSLPFPGTGQQANFRRKMAELVPLLP